MPTTDGEIVMMSYTKYREMCRKIDTLTEAQSRRKLERLELLMRMQKKIREAQGPRNV